MMKEKQQFKLKLNKIQKALFLYSDETYKDIALSDFELFGINVRYACMLQALLDVHYGTLKQQRSATAYFQSALFTEHCRDELYPVYYLGESANGFTIPKELVERYNKVMQEFAAVQEILRYIREPKVHDLPK